MTHEYNTVESKKRHKILVTCRLCHFTLSEAVQTPEEMLEHDRIWHGKGNISYFLVHQRDINIPIHQQQQEMFNK